MTANRQGMCQNHLKNKEAIQDIKSAYWKRNVFRLYKTSLGMDFSGEGDCQCVEMFRPGNKSEGFSDKQGIC